MNNAHLYRKVFTHGNGPEQEVLGIKEEIWANGKKVFESSGSKIVGEVEVIAYSKKDGKPLFTRSLFMNDLLVCGAVYFSEKANGMRSAFQTVPLDLELGVHTRDQIQITAETIQKEQICGIMVGNGGTSDVYNTVHKVNRAARSVPGMIPFRVVSLENDLKGDARARYILRAVKGNHAYYYGKRFDIDREINVEFEDGTVVPLDVDTMQTKKFVKVYSKYRATVDQFDIREYSKLTYGSTMRSLINSIGLITGYAGTAEDGATEYFNVRGITTANMENQDLKDSESTIAFIYKVYVV